MNRNQKLNLINVYAPTLEVSEKNPEIRDEFYSDISSVLNTISARDITLIAGDFNAKTGSAYDEIIYRNAIGRYGKGEVNSNGYHLLDFAVSHNFYLTNTCFKHKPSHITTWQRPEGIADKLDAKSNTVRRNPYRNQIDYILAQNNYKGIQISDSRSYSMPFSDHRLVMLSCTFKWPFVKRPHIVWK